MRNLDFISEERRAVISNIGEALAKGDSFAKVELSDPRPNEEEIKKVIIPFDNKRRSPVSKCKAYFARILAENFTKAVNKDTSIVGLDNALGITGGAIITANHYNPTDSTPIRMMASLMGKGKKLHIIVQQSNIFMTGLFGFLMKNCNTHPVSKNAEYTVKNLNPAIEDILKRGNLLLIYPEQEMWYNYKKPRSLRDGAYHYAALLEVPIIPTFTEMRALPGERDKDGFLPIKHILHILPPIYPDKNLSVRENRVIMQTKDYNMRKELYESVYGIPLTDDFTPERDIAGITL